MNGMTERARLTGVVGALWGTTLLVAGPRIWLALTGGRPTKADRIGMQALGARHLGQGVFQAVAPTTGQRVLVAADLLHATSMLALAATDAPRRRPALVSASVAMANAALMLWRRRGRGGTR